MFKVNNLSLKLNDKYILEDINFEVKRGKILGIVGPSGVGKTSLIKSMVGIYKGTKGNVLLDNEDIYDNIEIKKRIAYVPDEHNSFYLITLKEIIEYYKSIYENFDENKFYMINRIFKIPINKRFLQLSKGMKVRVNLMMAFSICSDIIVLDEPTSGLDPILKEKVLKLIVNESKKNKAIIISSHNLYELERICNDIVILNNGKVEYYNSLDNIKRNMRKIQVAFKEPVYEEDLNLEGVLNISQIGRVFTIITEKYNDNFKSSLESLNPLFIDEIGLSLEEVFINRLDGGEGNEEIFK
ncbi:ABC transporter ATP-binding protein [Clostridium carnis]